MKKPLIEQFGTHKNPLLNENFDKIYNAFNKKDYWDVKGQIKTMVGNWKRAKAKGDKGADQYTEQDIIDHVKELNRARTVQMYEKIKRAIKKNDIDYLKSILRHDQKVSQAFFMDITGKKLPKSTRDIHAFLEDFFGIDENINEAVNTKSINKWRVSIFEGSFQFDQFVHDGNLDSAKKETKRRIEKQYKRRPTNKSLWAQFDYKKDNNPKLKDYQGWEEVFKERIVFEDGKWIKESINESKLKGKVKVQPGAKPPTVLYYTEDMESITKEQLLKWKKEIKGNYLLQTNAGIDIHSKEMTGDKWNGIKIQKIGYGSIKKMFGESVNEGQDDVSVQVMIRKIKDELGSKPKLKDVEKYLDKKQKEGTAKPILAKVYGMLGGKRRTEVVTEETGGSAEDFAKQIKGLLDKHFPRSKTWAVFSSSISESISIRLAIGQKSDWSGGIIDNAPVEYSAMVFGINDGKTNDKMYLTSTRGACVYTKPPENSYLAMGRVNVPTRKTTGGEEKILKAVEKVLVGLKTATKKNYNNMMDDHKWVKKYI